MKYVDTSIPVILISPSIRTDNQALEKLLADEHFWFIRTGLWSEGDVIVAVSTCGHGSCEDIVAEIWKEFIPVAVTVTKRLPALQQMDRLSMVIESRIKDSKCRSGDESKMISTLTGNYEQ